jgi:hypothetical protein
MDTAEVAFDETVISDELAEISQVDIKELAISCVVSFFEDRRYESGGRIPRRELLREHHIAKILEYTPASTFVDGLTLIHDILDQNDPPDDFEQSNLVDWEIKLMNDLMAQSSKAGIPKSFAIGITLMNLQYCYGMTKWRIWS